MTLPFKKFPAIFYLLLLTLACRPIPKNYLHHHWVIGQGGQEMIFDGDSTLHWIFHNEALPDTFVAHYKLDESTAPDQLDLYDFSMGILKGKILAGIVEPHTADSILLDFEPADNFNEADSVRPKDFSPDQQRFFVRKK